MVRAVTAPLMSQLAAIERRGSVPEITWERHAHHIFELAGATNVKWVWSPAFASSETFPGSGDVNVLMFALSCSPS